MKQCPRCNRNYEDDALSFCLEDGTALRRKNDPDATMIGAFPPILVVPPTVASDLHGMSPSAGIAPPVYGGAEPTPRRRSPWAVGALVFIALAVGLTIGAFIFTRSNSTASDSQTVEPTRDSKSSNTATTMPVSATSSPTPVTAQTPASASNTNQSPVGTNSGCVLYNDKNDKSVIRVRMNCDTQNCDADSTTIAGEYPDNTPISVVQGSDVQGARFRWVKVVITGSGQTVWVASTKIKC